MNRDEENGCFQAERRERGEEEGSRGIVDTLVGNTKTVPLVKTENIGTHTSVPNYEWGRCVLAAAACVDFHQVSLYTFFTAGVGREGALGDPVDVERR